MFALTEEHVRLLRQSVVLWSPVESGAPAVLVSPLLMEGAEGEALEADFARRAGVPFATPPNAEQRAHAQRLIAEMPEALAQVLEHGTLAPGSYEYENPLVQFAFAAQSLPEDLVHLATDRRVRFSFTKEHAALLRRARWEGLWMNPKRPYGDMTYFELDIAEILGEHAQRDSRGRFPEEVDQRLGRLHEETLPALQLFLLRATIAPGSYTKIPVEPGLGGM